MTKKRSVNLAFLWTTAMLVSVLLPVIGDQVGKAGDCKPGQVDGQCGLSTFLGLVSGGLAGLVIAVCVTVYVLVALYRRRRLQQPVR